VGYIAGRALGQITFLRLYIRRFVGFCSIFGRQGKPHGTLNVTGGKQIVRVDLILHLAPFSVVKKGCGENEGRNNPVPGPAFHTTCTMKHLLELCNFGRVRATISKKPIVPNCCRGSTLLQVWLQEWSNVVLGRLLGPLPPQGGDVEGGGDHGGVGRRPV